MELLLRNPVVLNLKSLHSKRGVAFQMCSPAARSVFSTCPNKRLCSCRGSKSKAFLAADAVCPFKNRVPNDGIHIEDVLKH